MIYSAKVVFAVALFGVSSVATAKTRVGFTMGGFQSTESSMDGTTLYESSTTAVGTSPGLVVGQQFTPNIEAGGSIVFSSKTEESGGAEATTTETGAVVYLDYNFNPDSSTVFYAGPRLGMSSLEIEAGGAKSTTSATFYGAGGGMKYFLNPSVSFDAGATYVVGAGTTEVGGQESPEVDVKVMGISFGISVWL